MRTAIHSLSQRQRRQINRTAIEAIDKLGGFGNRCVELLTELLQVRHGVISFQAFDFAH